MCLQYSPLLTESNIWLILIGVTFVGVNKPLSQVVNSFEDQPDEEFKKLKKWENCDSDVQGEVTTNLWQKIHEGKGRFLGDLCHIQGLEIDIQLKCGKMICRSICWFISALEWDCNQLKI